MAAPTKFSLPILKNLQNNWRKINDKTWQLKHADEQTKTLRKRGSTLGEPISNTTIHSSSTRLQTTALQIPQKTGKVQMDAVIKPSDNFFLT